MIRIENVEVYGWEAAIRGMRNPMNSWDRSDSEWTTPMLTPREICNARASGLDPDHIFEIGPNDLKLMRQLNAGGSEHCKYRRMIQVYLDITAPISFWHDFDTYKVGTVKNSCSRMHTIHRRDLAIEDFSVEHISNEPPLYLENQFRGVISAINECRRKFVETGDKTYWYQLMEMLPQSFNQKATVMLNYEVLSHIYHQRKNHKLDEWREFCVWIESLPYSELITGKGEDDV